MASFDFHFEKEKSPGFVSLFLDFSTFQKNGHAPENSKGRFREMVFWKIYLRARVSAQACVGACVHACARPRSKNRANFIRSAMRARSIGPLFRVDG